MGLTRATYLLAYLLPSTAVADCSLVTCLNVSRYGLNEVTINLRLSSR